MFNFEILSKNSTKIFLGLYLFIFVLFYFPSFSNWWFEDDPFQYDYVSKITNPIDIFTNPETMNKFSRALAPMQVFSYWIDVKIFGFSPLAAYLHSFLSLLFTCVILYFVIKAWTQSNFNAMALIMIWLLLPSTIVIFRFIATRHYMEGFFFSLLTTYLVIKYTENKDKSPSLLLIPIFIFGMAAMLCKEIYSVSIIFLLLSFGVWYKKYILIVLSISFCLFYGFYRIWIFGTDLSYTMPFLGAVEYFRYLIAQSYTFAASKGSYFIYLGIFLATIFYIKKGKYTALFEFIFFTLLTIGVLFTLYPVAYAVLVSYKTPGTWYRIPFIINTILLIWGVYAVSRTINSKWFVLTLVLLSLIIIPGTWQTRKYWNTRMARAEVEGKFYLENSDKLLFSEEEASWFIPGVHSMYKVPNKHFINKNEMSGEHSKTMINNFSTIWKYEDGKFVTDEKLFLEIKNLNQAK